MILASFGYYHKNTGMKKNVMEREGITLFDVFSTIFTIWKKETPRRLFANRRIIVNMVRAARRRKRTHRKEKLLVPAAIAVSPTERCNLRCTGCYSRFHPKEEELSNMAMNTLLSDAVNCGVGMFVITGGEPFIRGDMTGFFRSNPEALFLVITNGTHFQEPLADELAACGNIIPVISIEGDEKQTAGRRGEGVYQAVFQAMELCRRRKMIFGFSTVCTNTNIEYVGSSVFVDEMAGAGCTLGFYNELIPMEQEDLRFLPAREQTERFKKELAVLRKEKPIVLINLPEDEYDAEGRCMAVGRGAMHINAEGWVEPCPFAHYARENINTHSFREILASPFLQALRDHPRALRHGEIGCSLVSNRSILEDIARQTGARKTSAAGEITAFLP